MSKIQHYGIKFPFNIVSDEKTVLDLNMSKAEMVKSEMMHIIFTPKGQRLRDPNFGTRLIQYIFSPNDGETWGDIVMEVKEAVKTYIPECNIQNIDVYETDNGLGLLVDIKYNVKESDGSVSSYQVTTPI